MNDTSAVRRPPPPFPLVVVTGFLGAGKTTLLNRLLREEALADSVVVVNEFGDVGLDHELMSFVEEGIVALPGGCLCCEVRSDLVNTLEELVRARDNGRIAPFARVIVETTGVADPIPVIQAPLLHPYLPLRYTLGGVVTVVDALLGAETLAQEPVALRQLAVADLVVLSKTDMIGGEARPAAVAAMAATIRAVNPAARVVTADQGPSAADIAALTPLAPAARPRMVRDWLAEERMAAPPIAGGHLDDIRSAVIYGDAPIPLSSLAMMVDLLRSNEGERILRLKGLVLTREHPEQPLVIHGVRHIFHPPVKLEAWPDDDHRTRLVVIGRGLDAAVIEKLYDAFTGVVRIDGPDREAILNNPLALGGGFAR